MSDKQFKYIIPGIDGGGSQVFEADSQEELVEQLGKAQENATVKIRQLAQQNAEIGQKINQTAPTNGAPHYDKNQFFSNLYENPDDAIIGVLERRMGMKFDDFTQDYQQTRVGAGKAIQNEVSAQFAQRHPELLQVSPEEDKHNANTISQILTENGWAFNIKNLEAAYAVARQENKLKLTQSNPFPEATMMPAPSTISRPTGAVNTSESEADFLQTAPLAQVKAYLEKKYSNQRG